ncbi:permease prefix domain 2-containing transporter [Bradyrhizobium sp. Arg237L]|uniref:permease prefix domain 2-containing transporter n=1 Tax=Bradyrhizobium sp. Arg237L TaxID=3003352 RepID=UPI00249F43DD|nr:permease prefix domain 2-containing transporter [Bradyrhizobium sp. Arg237L]MDI4236171.1 permease prefix domain 2-containing transporter [Bradyrhizobium sp. Arg237L]
MTDKNGDDDKQVTAEGYRAIFARSYEEKVTKVALGNLFLQKEIESARDEYTRLMATIKAAQEHLEKASELTARPPRKRSSPPTSAAFLLAFIAPKNSAQALLGDLEEMFQENVARFGERQARKMYWFEVARSVGPLVWQWVKRMGFVTLLVDYVRSKFGL